ncbi:MAG: hypothetical protein WAW37_14295 [Syntrophobacteraceae bacterium]
MENLRELLTLMTAVKMGTAIAMVVLLSVLAESAGPRFAGTLSGFPLGAAISLFFMGHDISPRFAAESALYTATGLIATQAFAYCYYRSSLMAMGLNKGLQVLSASFGGLLGYFLAALLLVRLRVNLVVAVLLPVFFILLSSYLFRGVETVRIEKKAGMSPRALIFRSVFAASSIVVITSVAGTIGPGWAGIFSAFPMTMLPFVALIHLTHDPEHAHAVLKHTPRGLGSLVVFALAVSLSYPTLGIYVGTAVSYGFAAVYLVAAQLRPVPIPKG